MFGARRRNFFEIFCMRIAGLLLLGHRDCHVPGVFDHMTDLFQPRFQSCNPHRRRSHIHAAPRLAEIKRHTDDADLLGGNAFVT